MIQVTFQKEDPRIGQEAIWEYFKMIYERAFPKQTEQVYVALARSVKNYMIAKDMEQTKAFPEYVRNFLKRKEMDKKEVKQFQNKSFQRNKLEQEYHAVEQEYLDFFEKMSKEDILSHELSNIQQTLKSIHELKEDEKISEVPHRNHKAFPAMERLIPHSNQKEDLQKLWYSYLEMRVLAFQTIEQFAMEIVSKQSIQPGFGDCKTYQKSIHALNALDEYGMSDAFIEDIWMFIHRNSVAQKYMDQDSQMMMKISDYLAYGQIDIDLTSEKQPVKNTSTFYTNATREYLEEYLFPEEQKHLR